MAPASRCGLVALVLEMVHLQQSSAGSTVKESSDTLEVRKGEQCHEDVSHVSDIQEWQSEIQQTKTDSCSDIRLFVGRGYLQ